MTARELNRDIKRLYVEYHKEGNIKSVRSELTRLWYADQTKTWTKMEQFKMLLIINRKLEVISCSDLTKNIIL